MSYDIIFQTKIVDLGDGRIIHFSRQGCNNDDEGREKNIYRGFIHDREFFVEDAEEYIRDGVPYSEGGAFELKIGSRPASMYDYGKHLLRMLKRAENVEQFNQNNTFFATETTGIQVLSPVWKEFTPEEFTDKVFYDLLYHKGEYANVPAGDLRYRRITKKHTDILECVKILSSGKFLEFYIKKHIK